MIKYAKLDDAILRAVGDKPLPFHQLFVGEVFIECKDIADTENKHTFDSFRVLDRRLQSLRKLGVIRNVTGKGWIKS